MCGIVGVVRHSGRPVSPSSLGRASALMKAGGPDASGQWISAEGTTGLAHRRLAIIDLDARSNQPFSDPSGRYQIVYNGEVYNFAQIRPELEARGHQFRT